MIYIFLLLIFASLLPTIHYLDIVDESTLDRWRPWKFNIGTLKYKLYGAYTFKDRRLDRLSVILTHLFTVWLVSACFGIKTALLWGVCPPAVYVAIWRNGRRYQFCNICAVLITMFKPLGIVFFLMSPLLQPALIPSFLLYLVTDYWYISVGMLLTLPFVYKHIKNMAHSKLKNKHIVLKTFTVKKLPVVFKTIAYFTYKLLIPQKEFIYQPYLQHYGTNLTDTKKYMKWDKVAVAGSLIVLALVICLFFDNTRCGAWWYLVFLLPYSNIITWHQHNNTRYAVLPAIGLFYLVSQFMPLWACILWSIFSYVNFIESMRMFMDSQVMFQYHFDHRPDAVAPYISMGKHYITHNQPNNAMTIIKVGLSRFPDSFGLWHLYILCKPHDIHKAFKKLKDLAPDQTFTDRQKISDLIKNVETFIKVC